MSNQILANTIVYGVPRCPQCGVSNPLLEKVDKAHKHYTSSGYQTIEYWFFTARCSKCRKHILFYGKRDVDNHREEEAKDLWIIRSYPAVEQAAEELPEMAYKFFQQALESKHAPDGALMLAASAIDAMLKDKGYKDGTLYARIQAAQTDGLLTKEMSAWAHEIRLSANDPRHADDNFSGASEEEAEQVIAFVKSLGDYLYVLPARVRKWQAKVSNDS